jgi:serpin B
LDFNNPASIGTINDWVNNKTFGKIPTIINSIDPNDVMYLINALYFKAKWTTKFDTNATKNGIFNYGSQQISCQMMNNTAGFMYTETSEAQIVQLPYSNGSYSMLVILPKQYENIDNFISGMSTDEWNNWLGALKLKLVNLSLPKYKFDYSIRLNKALTNFGMGIAFDNNSANFSNMCLTDKLSISYVLQKTFIGVGEEGTEAAAVTIVAMHNSSYIKYDVLMTIDHPFIFAICDNVTNTIEFMGKVVNPAF